MEERLLLKQNKEEINRLSGLLSYMIRDYLEPLAAELKKLEIEATAENLRSVIITGSLFLKDHVKAKAKKETETIPAIYSIVLEKYLKEIEPVIKLADETNYKMNNNRELGIDFFIDNVIVSEDWAIEENTEFRDNLIERFSEYADSDERKEIHKRAVDLINQINEFGDLIQKYTIPNTPYEKVLIEKYMMKARKLFPLLHWNTDNSSIITIDGDGELEINLENITFIK